MSSVFSVEDYSPEELGELARWHRYHAAVDAMEPAERIEFAGSHQDDPDCLDPLLKDLDPRVRAALAGNSHATETQLRWLGYQEWDHMVLVALAGNPACPLSVLDRLMASSDREIVRACREAHPDWIPPTGV